MTQVLWVTAIPPDRAGGGGHIRQAHLLHAVAQRADVDLVVAGTVSDALVRDDARSVVEVDAVQAEPPAWRPARRAVDVWGALVERDPVEVAQHHGVRRALAPHLERASGHDVVCIEYAGLAPLARNRPASCARWALTLHNLRSVMADHEAALEPGARQRWLLERDAAKAARFERWAMRAYDLVAVPSEEDRAVLGEAAVVVPNGVDTDAFRPTRLRAEPVIVFTGALYTQPNVDGLVWFCEQVLPRVQAARPDALLAIVGARPRPEVAALERRPGVRLDVDVPAIAPHLGSARVAVVPLRIGSGTRLKALEAMAAGRPVVGTAIGLGGIDVVPGVHALVADDAPAFADAVVSLLDDDERAGRLARHARALVEDRYSWQRIGAAYADALLP